jgi:hypothetical protein
MGNHSKNKKQLSFKISYAEYALIKTIADSGKMTVTDYLTALLQDLYVCDRPEWQQQKFIGIYVDKELKESVSEEAKFENVTIAEFIKRKVLKDFDLSQE